jgi:hypothetical protein
MKVHKVHKCLASSNRSAFLVLYFYIDGKVKQSFNVGGGNMWFKLCFNKLWCVNYCSLIHGLSRRSKYCIKKYAN